MPRFIIPIFRLVYLNNRQGSHTSIAAAVGQFETLPLYLQPYWLPVQDMTPFPLFEMLGPFEGSVVTKPRLPVKDRGAVAAGALWNACEELTEIADVCVGDK